MSDTENETNGQVEFPKSQNEENNEELTIAELKAKINKNRKASIKVQPIQPEVKEVKQKRAAKPKIDPNIELRAELQELKALLKQSGNTEIPEKIEVQTKKPKKVKKIIYESSSEDEKPATSRKHQIKSLQQEIDLMKKSNEKAMLDYSNSIIRTTYGGFYGR